MKTIEEYQEIFSNPNSVSFYESLLHKKIEYKGSQSKEYVIFKNIAYNLQYLEFLIRISKVEELNSVLEKQNIKTIIVISAGIIEAILFYEYKKIQDYKSEKIDKRKSFGYLIDFFKEDEKTPGLYKYLKDLKKLRDRVHIKSGENNTETDFNLFTETELKNCKYAMNHILEKYLKLDESNIKYFNFLK